MVKLSGGAVIGLSIRAFRWDDLPTLARVCSTVGALEGDSPMPPEDLRRWLELPTYQPEENCFLAEWDDEVVGWVQVVAELPIGRTVLEGGVHPRYRGRGIGLALLRRALERSRELGARCVHVGARETAEAACTLLASAGFHPVRRFWRMHREAAPVPSPQFPSHAILETFHEGEEDVLAGIQNRAFARSWGFCPNTVEDIARRMRVPGVRPEGVLFVRRDGWVVAYCWTRVGGFGHPRTGVIWMTGVDPAYRGRGMGRATLRAGMRYLLDQGVHAIELEVDERNTSARRLYFSEGFRDLYAIRWYEMLLADE